MTNIRRALEAAAGTGGGLPELWSWGGQMYNVGPLGLSNFTSYSSPKQVGALTDWAKLSCNETSTLTIKDDYTLWGFGTNAWGILGTSSTAQKSSPTQIGALTDWASVAVGSSHSAAVKTDGTLWTWGTGSSGQQGTGTYTSYKMSPVQVGALTNWGSIESGFKTSFSVKTDGTLWAWGLNTIGQLGLGDLTNRSSPVQIGALTTWASVSSTKDHVLAIKTDGTMWSWGEGQEGRTGHGNGTDLSSPVQVGVATDWAQCSAGGYHSAAVTTGGKLFTFGRGTYGATGLGITTPMYSPAQVGALTNWASASLSSNILFGAATKTDGTLWTWGANTYGQLGQSDTTARSSPIQVGSDTSWSKDTTGAEITTGQGTVLVLKRA
tara:strand:- start:108 stop:1247 length:1140 start_codon:yes stop_codon:yes gene_type:complete